MTVCCGGGLPVNSFCICRTSPPEHCSALTDLLNDATVGAELDAWRNAKFETADGLNGPHFLFRCVPLPTDDATKRWTLQSARKAKSANEGGAHPDFLSPMTTALARHRPLLLSARDVSTYQPTTADSIPLSFHAERHCSRACVFARRVQQFVSAYAE